jgi:hypothetical protein
VWETRKFLVLVKTYPNPSASTQEAVCTAAVDEDGKLTRLFPIPFRTLAEAQRFKKWQWIRAKVQKAPHDHRPESYKVDYASIQPMEEMPAGPAWAARWALVAHLVQPSFEAIRDSGASLGLIKPRNYSLKIEKLRDGIWSQDDIQKMLPGQGSTDLFGTPLTPRTMLEKLPVQMRYTFDCSNDTAQHDFIFEDWEIGQSWRSWRRRYPAPSVLQAALINKYVDEPTEKDNMYFFLGNNYKRQHIWMVIGQVRPQHLARKTSRQARVVR